MLSLKNENYITKEGVRQHKMLWENFILFHRQKLFSKETDNITLFCLYVV